MRKLDPRLAQMPLFAGLRDGEQELLAMVMREERFRPREVIFEEQAPGHSCYFIVAGEVEVLKRLRHGGERCLTTLRKNDLFGQIALIDAGARSATCRAKAKTTVFRLDRTDFQALFGSGSRFAFRFQLSICRIAAKQLREANRRFNLLLNARVEPERQEEEDVLQQVRDILSRSGAGEEEITWID